MEGKKFYGFTNDAIFNYVMSDKDTCLQVLRAVLPEVSVLNNDVSEFSSVDTGKTNVIQLETSVKGKHILFDIEMYGKDRGHTENSRILQKRSNILENLALEKNYQVYQVFLCTFDPFDRGLIKYTFSQKICNEDDNVRYEDNYYAVFINSKGKRF